MQAEDGIRDLTVTGVQTCALPISRPARFRRGSRGPRVAVAPPEIPKVGGVEVDPNFTPRIELVPVKPPEMPLVEPSRAEIGRASCRERGEISAVAVSLKKKPDRQR